MGAIDQGEGRLARDAALGGRSGDQHEDAQRSQPVAEGDRHDRRVGQRRRAARQSRRHAARRRSLRPDGSLGEPDFVFEQPVEWTVRPDGQEPYLYFYEKIPFTEDKFASAVEIRPSNFSVVHHSGAYIVDIPEGYSVKDGYLYDKDGKQVPPTEPMGRRASSAATAAARRRRQADLVRARPRVRAAPPRVRQAHSCRQVHPLGHALQPDRVSPRRIAAASASGSPKGR